MRVLVTGNAGFIGFHVARALLARGDAVVGLDVVNDYYDVSLKEARLAELDRAAAAGAASYRFIRADLATLRRSLLDRGASPESRALATDVIDDAFTDTVESGSLDARIAAWR